MRRKSIFLTFCLTIFLLAACQQETNDTIFGTWRATEIRVGIGSGFGEFESIEGQYLLKISQDLKVESELGLCRLNFESDTAEIGTLDVSFDAIRTNCRTFDFELNYEHAGRELFLNYLCIEGCQVKFEKLAN